MDICLINENLLLPLKSGYDINRAMLALRSPDRKISVMANRFLRGIASTTLLVLMFGGLAVAPASADLLDSDTELSEVTPELEETSLSDEEFVDSEVPDAPEIPEVSAVEVLPETAEKPETPSLPQDSDPDISIDDAPLADFVDVEVLSIVIEGTAKVGETLIAKATFNVVPDYVEYQWFADQDEIEGADGLTLLLTSDLVDKRISVGVYVEMEESEYFSVEWSDETDPVTQGEEVAPPVVSEGIEITSLIIEGKPKVGQTLTAKATFNMDPDLVMYQWFADDEFIDGAEDSTLLLTPNLVGKKISVVVLALLEGSEDYDLAWSDETAAITAADKVTGPVVSEEDSVEIAPVADKVVVTEATHLPDTGVSLTTPLAAGVYLTLLGAAAVVARRRLVRN